MRIRNQDPESNRQREPNSRKHHRIQNRNVTSQLLGKKVTADDDWSHEFTELPAYSEDGLTAYTYTVDEDFSRSAKHHNCKWNQPD